MGTEVTNKPYIIAISAVSGGGKTALSESVHQALPGSVLLRFDDFDATNIYPDDYYEWSRRGGDLLEFDCPGMREAVEKEIERGAAKYIVLDYPFGREHPRLRDLINLSVFIDTPLDVAMARRLIRDYQPSSESSAAAMLKQLREEMAYYLEKARFPYLLMYRQRGTSDLVLDGTRSLEKLTDQVLKGIRESRTI